MTDISAFAKHFNKRLAAMEKRQAGFDEDVSSLVMALRLRPVERREPPVVMVRDPDRDKYERFSLSIDSALARGEIPPVHWRTLWIHLCKKATMAGDRDLLGTLLEIYDDLEENGGCNEVLEALWMAIG